MGAAGFIGRHLATRLAELAIEHFCPPRDEIPRGSSLGTIVYCIGVTGDFRVRALGTVRAHVCRLLDVLESCMFDSLVYLSSTRIYERRLGVAREEDAIAVNSLDASDLYNISKIMGEAAVLASGHRARVVRLSHVYGVNPGSPTFLSTMITRALMEGRIHLRTSLESSRDFVSVHDVVEMLIRIAREGRQSVYNLASGSNTSNAGIVSILREHTGCEVSIAEHAETTIPPRIAIDRLVEEFGFAPRPLLPELPHLIHGFRAALGERWLARGQGPRPREAP